MQPENIQLRPLSKLKKWDRNYRIGNMEAIIASITQFGFNQALRVWQSDTVMAGNHSFMALATMKGNGAPPPHGIVVDGEEWLVPCIDVSHLSKKEAEAYAVADNRTGELAENDPQRLSLLLQEINDSLGSLDAVGYSMDDLDDLLREVEQGNRQELEDPGPANPNDDDFGDIRVQKGDIWKLGEHRLMCGSSRSEADVLALMDGKKASLFSTDPPYLVDYTGAARPENNKDWSEYYHEVEIKDADQFVRDLFTNGLKVCNPNAAIYCWHASRRAALIEEIWKELGILYHQQIIWRKPVATQSYSMFPWQHEPCLMGWLQSYKPERFGDYSHDVTSVWDVDWEGKMRLVGNDHPTQKPVELFARPMRYHTKPGDICFEPFSGSGTQIIAGEKESRIVFAMEIEPRFCEVGIRRWEEMTGQTAELLHRSEEWRVGIGPLKVAS